MRLPDMHATSMFTKSPFTFSKQEAALVVDALEFSAAWDKVGSYYDLQTWAKHPNGPASITVDLSQRDCWRILDGLMLRKNADKLTQTAALFAFLPT